MFIRIYIRIEFFRVTLTIVVDRGGGSSRRFCRERRKRGTRWRSQFSGIFRSRRSRHAYPISPLESSYVCQRGPPTPRDLASDHFASERAGTTRDAQTISLTSRPVSLSQLDQNIIGDRRLVAVVAKDPGPYIRREPALSIEGNLAGSRRSPFNRSIHISSSFQVHF